MSKTTYKITAKTARKLRAVVQSKLDNARKEEAKKAYDHYENLEKQWGKWLTRFLIPHPDDEVSYTGLSHVERKYIAIGYDAQLVIDSLSLAEYLQDDSLIELSGEAWCDVCSWLDSNEKLEVFA